MWDHHGWSHKFTVELHPEWNLAASFCFMHARHFPLHVPNCSLVIAEYRETPMCALLDYHLGQRFSDGGPWNSGVPPQFTGSSSMRRSVGCGHDFLKAELNEGSPKTPRGCLGAYSHCRGEIAPGPAGPSVHESSHGSRTLTPPWLPKSGMCHRGMCHNITWHAWAT